MNKKTIISKTVTFVSIIAFIIAFIKIFGEDNTLIGVTTITATLMFLANDLTLKPVKNTGVLICFNVFLGVMAYLATTNMYLGFLINFVVMFIIGFTLCHNLKMPSYLPFSLQYIFMLSMPVTLERLPMRICSLIFGAIVIVGYQMIVNRGKSSKYADNLLINTCVNLNEKIKLIERNENTEAIDCKIQSDINSFRKIIYDKREMEFYLTEEGRIKVDISIALSRISVILNDIKENNNLVILEKNIVPLIDKIKTCLTDINKLEDLDNLFEDISKEEITDYTYINIMNLIEFIEDDLHDLKNLEKKDYNLIKKVEDIPKVYKNVWKFRNEISRDSLRFTYGFRLALGIALGAFIVDFFNLPDGRWIYFTVNAINQPQYEQSKKKSVDRITGTVMGIVVITILFTIFKDPSVRGLLIMASGYISSYVTQYKYSMICVTASAVGSAALVGNVWDLAGFRIIYVIIGVVISMLISKFIFPYSLEDSKKNLITRYNQVVERMIQNIFSNNTDSDNEMKNLIIYSSLIEDKLISTSSNNFSVDLIEYLKEQHLLVMNLYYLYRHTKKDNDNKETVIKTIQYLKKYKEDFTEERLLEIKNEIVSHKFNKDKLLFMNTIEILEGCSKVKGIKVC